MAEQINLAERSGLNLQLTDRDGNSIVEISLQRGVEDLPQLNIKRLTAEGEIDSMLTVFDLQNI